jgi:hypothetical protein
MQNAKCKMQNAEEQTSNPIQNPKSKIQNDVQPEPETRDPDPELDEAEARETFWKNVNKSVGRLGETLGGKAGVLSHYPILAMGFIGIGVVCRRYWPRTVKTMAMMTLAAFLTLVVVRAIFEDRGRLMYANSDLLVVGPLLLYWAGAWLRTKHGPVMWGIVIGLLAFSMVVSLIGAAEPTPPGGFKAYTAWEAGRGLLRGK